MTAAKNRFVIHGDGRLEADAQALAKLKDQEFEIQENGHIIPIGPRPRKLHEIKDAQARMKAFNEFIQKIGHPGPANLPDNWDSRDSIYD